MMLVKFAFFGLEQLTKCGQSPQVLQNARYCGLGFILCLAPAFVGTHSLGAGADVATIETGRGSKLQITIIDPPEKGFFSKVLDFDGIPIKAHRVVADEALMAAYGRLSLLLTNLIVKQPMVLSNLAAAGAELHIIGRDQVTTDLPEWRHDKGKKLAEYNGLTRDERTRGMGGRLTSCGEENLLKLANDRYRGRDICLHEFSHNIRNHGIQPELRARFDEQFRRSLAKGLWQGA